MEKLIDVYKKRLKIAKDLLDHLPGFENREARIRTRAIVNCYNYFIIELEQEMSPESNKKGSLDLKDVLNIEAKIDLKEIFQRECSCAKNTKSVSSVKMNLFAN